jgi:hypothetical protein
MGLHKCDEVSSCEDLDFGQESAIGMTSKNSTLVQNCEESVGMRECEHSRDFKLVGVQKVSRRSIRTCDDVVSYNPRGKQFTEMSIVLDIRAIFQASNADSECGLSRMNVIKSINR